MEIIKIKTPIFLFAYPIGFMRIDEKGLSIWFYDGTALLDNKEYVLPKSYTKISEADFLKHKQQWDACYS